MTIGGFYGVGGLGILIRKGSKHVYFVSFCIGDRLVCAVFSQLKQPYHDAFEGFFASTSLAVFVAVKPGKAADAALCHVYAGYRLVIPLG